MFQSFSQIYFMGIYMQKIVIKKSISIESAQKIIAAAIQKALEIGKPMVIAIVDESGLLKAFQRMDGAALVGIELAQNKAYTAVANAGGRATHEIYESILNNPKAVMGIPQLPRYTLSGGGFPIKIEDQIVGAIGVSGGTAEQDLEVARAALRVLS